ncbi:MAG: hypothetical protein ACTHLH_06965 [Solirubrobacterales bacterium]
MKPTNPAPDPFANASDLPSEWTENARETFLGVSEELGDSMTAAQSGSLWHACALETAADRLDAVAAEAGYVSRGSTGQIVAHPAAVEARLARTSAATILGRLTPAAPGSQTERSRRAARARWSRPGA